MQRLYFRHLSRNIIHSGKNFYVTSFFNNLMSAFGQEYSDIKFINKNYPEYEKHGYGGVYSCMSMSLMNPDNGKYAVFSFFDNWKYHFMTHMGWEPQKMTQFFYAGGFNFLDYYHFKRQNQNNSDTKFPVDMDTVYQGLPYSSYYDCCTEMIDVLYKNRDINKTIPKLFFRGYMWDFRKEMTTQFGQRCRDIIILDKNQENENIEYQEYLKEVSTYKCALSLPGGTEVCNRDIECFALGVPVIRPIIVTNYPDPLIPNYHYISCYHNCDYMDNGNPKYLNPKDMQDNTIYIWDRVKNNHEYLSFITKNARAWYERNCGMNNNISRCINLTDLELLK